MQDEQFMRRAIALACRGGGYVTPNPMVGAVLMYNGHIIGEGWHARYGDLHAEAACFESVAQPHRELIPQSTMYVTLEPCAHQGKQPPCAHRIVREQVKKVVIAHEDPFPQVDGRGVAILKEAGIEVELGTCRDEAAWMCRRFLSAQTKQRPYVVLKWAQSADGFIAPLDGSRRQLSNNFSQILVHQWRTGEAAIMVGYNTARADNPRLSSRLWDGPQPLRIVLDRQLRLPASHHLFDNSVETWIVNESRKNRVGDTSLVKLSFDENLLPALLDLLLQSGRTSVFVEGGAKLLDSFIAAGLWDEARIFSTDVLLGEGIAVPALPYSKPAFSAAVGDDVLSVRVPAGTHVPEHVIL